MKRGLVLFITVILAFAPTQLSYAESGFVREDFVKLMDQGFGDHQNAYAWSMEYFNGNIYVGTGRCSNTFCAMVEILTIALGIPVEDISDIPEIDCPPFIQEWLNITTLQVKNETGYEMWRDASRAEIWRYSQDAWQIVYRADLVPTYLQPPTTSGRTMPETSGFRMMKTFTDKNGVEALYTCSGGINFASPAYRFLMLRSTDGITWTKVSTPPIMGTDGRAMAVHGGKLYVGAGRDATVWCTDDPSSGSWTLVFNATSLDSNNTGVVSLASFNDYLYVGTENRNGFQVWRSTVPNPTHPLNDWAQIVSDGAGDRYNVWAGTMKEFKGYLYVGSMSLPFLSGYNITKGFDLIRIDPSDNWELIIGPYVPVDPPGSPPYPIPISFWPSGFGNPFNFYCWSMEIHDDYLYLGTFDASVFLRYLTPDQIESIVNIMNEFKDGLSPEQRQLIQQIIDQARASGYLSEDQAALLKRFFVDDQEITSEDLQNMILLFGGADLWKTNDGISWIPVSLNGFDNPNNYGFRVQRFAPNTLYVGTSNPFQGCEVWKTKAITPSVGGTIMPDIKSGVENTKLAILWPCIALVGLMGVFSIVLALGRRNNHN